jgi:ABC-2 type transport system permease protein
MKPYFCLSGYFLRSQFYSVQTWAFLGISFAFLAYIFALLIEQSQSASLSSVFWWAAFLSLFQAPLLCMSLFSKEGRSDFTLLLRTLGLNAHALVWLSYIQRLILLITLDLILVLQFFYLQWWGNPDPGLHLSGLSGLLLLQGSYLAISILMASLTRRSTWACLASMGLLIFSWLIHYSDLLLTGSLSPLGTVLKEFSIYKHFYAFLLGGFYLHDLGALIFSIILALYVAGLALKR